LASVQGYRDPEEMEDLIAFWYKKTDLFSLRRGGSCRALKFVGGIFEVFESAMGNYK
jgi:hypothetical protein